MTVNLLSANQSSFETDISGVDVEGAYAIGPGPLTNGGVTVSQDATQFQFGTKSLKVVTGGGAAFQYVNFHQPVNGQFTPGAQYTLSLYIFAAAGGATLRLYLESSGGSIGTVGNITLAAGWNRYTTTTTMSNPITATWVALRLDTGSVAQALTLYLDGLQIEQGAAATAWVLGTGNTAAISGGVTGHATLSGAMIPSVRGNNEAMTTDNVLAALGVVMAAFTQLAVAKGVVTVNDESPLMLDTVQWPALLLMEGPQQTVRIHARTWQKKLTIFAFYLAPWTTTPQTNDRTWADVNADMERMIANLADNPTLFCTLPGGTGPQRYCLEIVEMEPSPRTQKVIDDRTYGRGQSVVQRMLTIKLNLPPYIGAA